MNLSSCGIKPFQEQIFVLLVIDENNDIVVNFIDLYSWKFSLLF